jgi:hypothetical protein
MLENAPRNNQEALLLKKMSLKSTKLDLDFMILHNLNRFNHIDMCNLFIVKTFKRFWINILYEDLLFKKMKK